jgi:hypothetical protein
MPHQCPTNDEGKDPGREPAVLYLGIGGALVGHSSFARPRALLPGSFNPLHHGHTGLAAAAAVHLGVAVAFELSVANVDKPELDADEVARRVAQFAGVGPIWVTRAATFAAKAGLFPRAAFVVGWDTAVRLIDVRYYAADAARRDACLRALSDAGCRVVVGGRAGADGHFRTWDGGGVPAVFRGLFVPLAEADFRADVSSTSLRNPKFEARNSK